MISSFRFWSEVTLTSLFLYKLEVIQMVVAEFINDLQNVSECSSNNGLDFNRNKYTVPSVAPENVAQALGEINHGNVEIDVRVLNVVGFLRPSVLCWSQAHIL